MRPHFRVRIIGSTACVQRNADLRLTVMVRSKSSSVRSSTPLTIAIPALLTRMSIEPSSDSARSTRPATAAASETSAAIDGPAAGGHDALRQRLRFGRAFAIIDGDGGAGFRQHLDDRRANAARATGHQRHMSVQTVCRHQPSSSASAERFAKREPGRNATLLKSALRRAPLRQKTGIWSRNRPCVRRGPAAMVGTLFRPAHPREFDEQTDCPRRRVHL